MIAFCPSSVVRPSVRACVRPLTFRRVHSSAFIIALILTKLGQKLYLDALQVKFENGSCRTKVKVTATLEIAKISNISLECQYLPLIEPSFIDRSLRYLVCRYLTWTSTCTWGSRSLGSTSRSLLLKIEFSTFSHSAFIY